MTTLRDVATLMGGKFLNVLQLEAPVFWQKVQAAMPANICVDAAGPTKTAVFRLYVFSREPQMNLGILFLDKDGNVYVEGEEPVDALLKLRYHMVRLELRLKAMEARENMLENEVKRGKVSEWDAYMESFTHDDDLPLLERPMLNHEGTNSVH